MLTLYILPWYSGATSSIPDFITSHYLRADGWKMVYNFCTRSNYCQEGGYYLIFYNIFSGTLRTFIYNNFDVSSSNATFWQLSFSRPTGMLNGSEYLFLPMDKLSSETEFYVMNVSRTPAKNLTRGWNSFDFDLCYDKNCVNQNLFMNIDLYDILKENIDITGDVDLTTEGSLLTLSSSKGNTNSVLKSLSSFAGKESGKYLEKNFNLSGLIVKGVKTLVEKGINLLVGKIFGKKNSNNIENSYIKLTTQGTVTLKGEMTQTHSTNVLPLSHLMIPGTQPTPEDTFLPSYNEPLGVWNLESYPKLCYGAKSMYCYTFDATAFHNQYGPYEGNPVYMVRRILDTSSIKVIINPAVLAAIEKYEVQYTLFNTREDYNAHADKISGYLGRELAKRKNSLVQYVEDNWCYYVQNENASQIVYFEELMSHCRPGHIFMEELGYPIYDIYPNWSIFECAETPVSMQTRNDKQIENDVYVNVVLTLYPKSPYNQTPYVSSRNFQVVNDCRIIDEQ